jgi:hypothetical protein
VARAAPVTAAIGREVVNAVIGHENTNVANGTATEVAASPAEIAIAAAR